MGYNFSLFFVGNFERIGEILQQDGRFVKDYLNKKGEGFISFALLLRTKYY